MLVTKIMSNDQMRLESMGMFLPASFGGRGLRYLRSSDLLLAEHVR